MTSSRSKGRVGTRGPRIAFVQSAWHQDIVEQGFKGFVAEWKTQGHEPSAIDAFLVPGAFEIPLHAQMLAKTGRYAAIVAAGFVVDGGIYRHDFVADVVIKALMQVQLATEVPVFSMVLTPHQSGIDSLNVAAAAAVACHATIRSLEAIRSVTG